MGCGAGEGAHAAGSSCPDPARARLPPPPETPPPGRAVGVPPIPPPPGRQVRDAGRPVPASAAAVSRVPARGGERLQGPARAARVPAFRVPEAVSQLCPAVPSSEGPLAALSLARLAPRGFLLQHRVQWGWLRGHTRLIKWHQGRRKGKLSFAVNLLLAFYGEQDLASFFLGLQDWGRDLCWPWKIIPTGLFSMASYSTLSF